MSYQLSYQACQLHTNGCVTYLKYFGYKWILNIYLFTLNLLTLGLINETKYYSTHACYDQLTWKQ